MKRLLPVVIVVLAAAVVAWLMWRGEGDPQGTQGTKAPQAMGTIPPLDGAPPAAAAALPPPKEDLSGDYLQGYGVERGDAARDLALVKDVLTAFQYSVKVPDALPTAGNRDIMAAMQGDNPYRIRFLDPAFDFLNANGELEDRWGTPLYFHFVEATDPAIRSAGPDRVMWTDDDVVHGEYAGEQN